MTLDAQQVRHRRVNRKQRTGIHVNLPRQNKEDYKREFRRQNEPCAGNQTVPRQCLGIPRTNLLFVLGVLVMLCVAVTRGLS